MFRVLASHEEREPKAVLRNQSKRAQKRLSRQEALREKKQEYWETQSRAFDEDQTSSSNAPTAALHMYEEIFYRGDLDPGLLEHEGLQKDIIAQLQRAQQEPAGPSGGGGGEYGANAGHAAHGRGTLTCADSTDLLHPRCHVDLPPGPGPGSGSRHGQCQHRPADAWRCRQGSALSLAWAEPGPPGAARAGSEAVQQRQGDRSAADVLLRFGFGAGYGPTEAAAAGGADSTGSGTASLCTAREGRAPGGGLSRQQWDAADGARREGDFPQLRGTVPAAAGSRRQGHHVLRRAGGGGLAAGRHGAHHSGVKVLHTARAMTHGSTGQDEAQGLNGGSLQKGHRHGAGSGGGDDAPAATEFNLSLLWDLIQGGLYLRGDPLAADGGCLEAPEPDDVAAIKRLIWARYPEDDGPARGVGPEDMIAMMARAHRRQCKKAGGAATNAGADSSSDDEPHLYLGCDEFKTWRRTVERMKENDWVLVTDTDGKHYKYRRWLPNGQIQTQTVCCSPSDAKRGIRNLHAELARKDDAANAVIRAWRRQERERRRKESAASAARRQS